MQYYVRFFQNYANFKGRDSRKQYWMFVLINVIISFVISLVDSLLFGSEGVGILSTVYSLAILIPSLAISIRRLHDTNRSGFWILICLVPIIGWIWYIVLLCLSGTQGPNRFGEQPTE